MSNSTTALSLAAALALISGPAQAAVLYSHTFDGGASNLNLVGPDVANTGTILGANHGTSTANWVITGTSPSFAQNGAIADDTQGQLAFNPVDGFVYTLTINATVLTAAGTDWSGVGFADDSDGSRLFETGVVWGLMRGASTANVAFLDGTSDNRGSTTLGGSTNTLTIELDTRDGIGFWDASYFIDGSATAFATATDISTTLSNSIDTVAIGSEGSTDTINSFSLSVAIPEPSSSMLLGLGGLMLALRRRRAC